MNILKNILIVFIGITALTGVSCSKSDESAAEQKKIQDFVKLNNITTKPNASGLYYIETLAGSGSLAKVGNKVTVHYTGKFLDGKVFDSSIGGQPFQFTLGKGQVIAGWDEGVALMKKGGKATLIVPSNLGYGADGYSSIPGYSALIFDVQLVDVK